MRLVRLILVNIKRQLKNPIVLGVGLVMPIVILVALFSGGFSSSSGELGIIDKSKSAYSKELINKLRDKYSIEILKGEVESNFDLLRNQKLGAIYVIEDTFDEKLNEGIVPNIKCYQTETTNGLIMADNIINEYVSGIIEEGISSGLSTNSIVSVINEENVEDNEDYTMSILMFCYCMIIGGASISDEILKLKSQKVLRRTIATNNSDFAILGSLFISSFIIQAFLSCLALVIVTLFIDIPNANIMQGILVLSLNSLISTSMIVAVTRWIKNPTLANMMMIILGMAAFGLTILSSSLIEFENIPAIITNLSLISPLTWLLKILANENVVFSIIVVILMSLVFFTAGSFKLREYVKE